MLRRGSIVLSIWSIINFILAFIILSYVIVLKKDSPILQVASFSEADIASLSAKTIAALNCFTILYNFLFFQSRLIPRWLSGFGIAAITSLTTACVLSLFSGNRITSYIPLAFPIFVQELVLAVWLIAKGFNPSAVASGAAKTSTNELLSTA